MRGVVAAWIDARGYGFITPDAGGPDVFVHMSSIRYQPQVLKPGERVEFTLKPGSGGRPLANRVSRLVPVAAVIAGAIGAHGQ